MGSKPELRWLEVAILYPTKDLRYVLSYSAEEGISAALVEGIRKVQLEDTHLGVVLMALNEEA